MANATDDPMPTLAEQEEPIGEVPFSSRTASAYDELRAMLLSGFYPPDSHLTEAGLTQQLGVSRGTVRSVLARLAQEGYVASEANRGVRTRSFTVDEAVEILETREVLESALAAKAAERATPEDIAEMVATCELMVDVQKPGAGDAYSKLNRRFHEQIRRAARQGTLTRFVESLLYPLVMRQYRDLDRPHPRTESLEEHRAILAAIITHNPDAARAAMRHHVASARHALLLKYGPQADA
jgi:DNA-binding GntR family transcriptional regulator